MSIIPSFLADVETKVPNICGFPFKVNPKAQYATTGLYQASIQVSIWYTEIIPLSSRMCHLMTVVIYQSDDRSSHLPDRWQGEPEFVHRSSSSLREDFKIQLLVDPQFWSVLLFWTMTTVWSWAELLVKWQLGFEVTLNFLSPLWQMLKPAASRGTWHYYSKLVSE